MMEFRCPSCGNIFDDTLGVCPACGSAVSHTAETAPFVEQIGYDYATEPAVEQPSSQGGANSAGTNASDAAQNTQAPPSYQYQSYSYGPGQSQQPTYGQQTNYQNYAGYPQANMGYAQKSKITAGLLGIFLGGLGVHNFYLGYTGKAVAQLLITLLSCGALAPVSAIWGLIEGILILVGTGITTDASGRPLND